MRTTVDAAGRLILPEEIRLQAGLLPGTPLDVRWHDGRIEIEPAPVLVALIRKGRFVVAVPQANGPVLTSKEVKETRDAIVREHEQGL